MSSEIQQFRLSFIWVETNLGLLSKTIPADAPLQRLARRASYEEFFAEVLKNQKTHKDVPLLLVGGDYRRVPELGPPWPKPTGQAFWGRYLQHPQLDTLSGTQAWRALVPIRAKFPCDITPGQWLAKAPVPVEIAILPEAFFYPHGVAFVLTAIVRVKQAEPAKPGLALFDAVDLALRIKRDKFGVAWNGNAGLFSLVNWDTSVVEMTLQELANRALPIIRVAAFGPNAAPVSQFVDPFTVFTVISGSGVDAKQPIDEDVRRALEGVTRWSATWRDDPLADLKERTVEIKTSPAGHMLYGRPKARAAWLPTHFKNPDNQAPPACYHRNLTLISMQVESMCGLVAATAELIRQQQLDSEGLKDCARQAGGALGRLYSGGQSKSSTQYRSMSPRTQMIQNNFIDDIDKVRMELGVSTTKLS